MLMETQGPGPNGRAPRANRDNPIPIAALLLAVMIGCTGGPVTTTPGSGGGAGGDAGAGGSGGAGGRSAGAGSGGAAAGSDGSGAASACFDPVAGRPRLPLRPAAGTDCGPVDPLCPASYADATAKVPAQNVGSYPAFGSCQAGHRYSPVCGVIGAGSVDCYYTSDGTLVSSFSCANGPGDGQGDCSYGGVVGAAGAWSGCIDSICSL
jgi:hypothetical protein